MALELGVLSIRLVVVAFVIVGRLWLLFWLAAEKLMATMLAEKKDGMTVTLGASGVCFIHGHTANGINCHFVVSCHSQPPVSETTRNRSRFAITERRASP
jgi:hypothetical protein